MMIFYYSASVSWNSTLRKSFPFSSIFMYLFTYQYGIMDSYTLDYNSLQSFFFFYFVVQIVLDLAIKNSFRLVPYLFLTCFCNVFFFFFLNSTSFLFGTKKCPRLIFAFSVSTLDFSKDLSLFRELYKKARSRY